MEWISSDLILFQCGAGVAFNAKVGMVRMLGGVLTDQVEGQSLVYALDRSEKQGKIVAELQPTEARLRQACMRKVPQVIKAKQSSKKSHHQKKRKAEELQWSFANSLRRSAVKIKISSISLKVRGHWCTMSICSLSLV